MNFGATSGKLTGLFLRTTSSGNFIPQIDGLRFVALASVFVLHLNHQVVGRSSIPLSPNPDGSWFYRLLEGGEFGVQLFFALSGFILALPFASHALLDAKRVSLKRFYFRRLTRLEPPLIINLLIIFALMTLALGRSAQEYLPNLFATMGYLHNLIFGENSVISGVTWSLEVEAQFYLLTPFLTFVFKIPGKWLRRGTIIAIALFFAHIGGHFWKSCLASQLEHFMVGFLLADIYLLEWNSKPENNRIRYWDIIGTVSWLVMALLLFFQNELQGASRYFLPVCTFLAFYATFRGHFYSWLASRPYIVMIGGMCYTFYLYHMTIISALTRLTSKFIVVENYFVYYSLHLLILFPITVAISALFFLAFEKPFMDPKWPSKARTFLSNLLGKSASSES